MANIPQLVAGHMTTIGIVCATCATTMPTTGMMLGKTLTTDAHCRRCGAPLPYTYYVSEQALQRLGGYSQPTETRKVLIAVAELDHDPATGIYQYEDDFMIDIHNRTFTIPEEHATANL